MNEVMLEYSNIDSPIHKLTGATKLICLILWSLVSMVTYNTYILCFMALFSIVIFKISKVKFSQISFVFYFIMVFLLINNVAIFVFSPYEGVNIYGSETKILHIAGFYSITLEQLFYQLNVSLKYFSIIPVALVFMVATNPSEFAASLNKIGVNYKIAYSVAIALRYIPDIQHEYQDISFAAQARGIDMSKNEKFLVRMKNSVSILMPLIFSSLDRIETISAAMELRAFGNNKKRTWYSGRKFEKRDYLAIFIMFVIFVVAVAVNIKSGSRFYNPFI